MGNIYIYINISNTVAPAAATDQLGARVGFAAGARVAAAAAQLRSSCCPRAALLPIAQSWSACPVAHWLWLHGVNTI